MKSSQLLKILKRIDLMNVWTASYLSAALMGGLYILSVKVFDADPKSAGVVAIVCATLMACLLIAEGENRDRQG